MRTVQHLEVDGTAIADHYQSEKGDKVDGSPWDKYRKLWVFDFTNQKPEQAGSTSTPARVRKCYQRGGSCQRADIFSILGVDWNDLGRKWPIQKKVSQS